MELFLKSFAAGKMVIVFDEHRECEGDFFILGEHITPESVNFLLTYGKGLICTAAHSTILDRLEIPLMMEANENPHGTNFCMLVDAKEGITTGVSAPDRSKTISLLANPLSKRDDFVIPGHSHPLRAVEDFSKRFGHTEAAVGLAEKLDKYPVVVICEILNEVGEKANFEELVKLSEKFEMPMVNLVDLEGYL